MHLTIFARYFPNQSDSTDFPDIYSHTLHRYHVDFGPEKDILNWILNYLDATKAGLLTYLLSDGGSINFVYQDYDWSLNS